jgi:hypothetical protein
MRIVVDHLTRMQKGFMCVAGIELVSRRHIRPVLDRQMRVEMLACHGGPFDLGRIVELGETKFVGRVPEIEDQQFDARRATVVDQLAGDEFRQWLESTAVESLDAIFGRELQNVGHTCAIVEQRGLRSLGCLWVRDCRLIDETAPSGGRRLRCEFTCDRGVLRVPVTDVNLYGEDHITIDEQQVVRVAERLRTCERVLVSVGLSRPYRRSEGDLAMHWLQVNNIHLACWG